MKTLEERFWPKVDQGGTDACWLWKGYVSTKGYGYFHMPQRPMLAHRVAWTLLVGSIPTGMQLDHRCHVRHCVNPSHLRVVTNKQNNENRCGPNAGKAASAARGVSLHKPTGRWRANVVQNGKMVSGGTFATEEEAAKAAADLRRQLFTHNDADRVAP